MDITTQRIIKLIEIQNMTANKLQVECELSNNAITKWKNGTNKPSAENIVKIATYFNVTTDYLLGLSDNKEPQHYISIEPTIPEFVYNNWHKLDTLQQELIENTIKDYIEQNKQISK